MMLSLGLDLSATASGVMLLRQGLADPMPEVVFEREIKPKALDGAARVKWIATEVMTIIHAHKLDALVMEGYGLNLKHPSSIIPLAELGGVVRFRMHLDGITWFDPRPSELKKFSTGKGNAPKDVVIMHVFKRWGYTAKTNNLADAYVAAAMGLARLIDFKWATKEMRKQALDMVPLTN